MVHEIRAGTSFQYLVCWIGRWSNRRRHRIICVPTGQEAGFLGLAGHVCGTWCGDRADWFGHPVRPTRYAHEGSIFIRVRESCPVEACCDQSNRNRKQEIQAGANLCSSARCADLAHDLAHRIGKPTALELLEIQNARAERLDFHL